MLDFRSYLALEVALTRRLQKTWRSYASPIYSAIDAACARGDWAAARAIVPTLNMQRVGYENRNAIKYLLLSTAIFGAGLAHDDPPNFLGLGTHNAILDTVTTQILTYLQFGGTQQAQEDALQSIALLENPVVQKADPTQDPRYLKPFVSFQDSSNAQLQLVASLNANRIASWGFVAEADTRGITEYQLVAVLDGRTSKFCELINGTVFQVEDARELLDRALTVQDPNSLKTIQPWPNQSKASIAEFREMTPDELRAAGYFVPPFHPNCRTLISKVGTAKPQRTTVQSMSALPKQMQDSDSFREIGINVTDQQADKWNAVVGLNPLEVMAAMSQSPAQDILENEVTKSVNFFSNGNIGVSTGATTEDIRAQVGTIFDPFTGKFYLSKADLTIGNAGAEAKFVKRMFSNLVNIGLGASAEALVVGASAGEAAYYAKMGFLPTPIDWQHIRSDALENPQFTAAVSTLPDSERAIVMALVQNNDEASLEVLMEIPYTYDGQTIGQIVLGDFSGPMELNLGDNFAVDKAKEYLDETSSSNGAE